MKIFQLIDWITRLFKLNNKKDKATVIALMMMSYYGHTQTNAAFWFGRVTESAAPLEVEYLVVAGGGGGSNYGGGGAGGFRTGSFNDIVISSNYVVTVGSGGAGGVYGSNGQSSIFNTITSAGGGYGATAPSGTYGITFRSANDGGSGGGAEFVSGVNGSGNTPFVIPSQGNDGGSLGISPSASGGGGAGETGFIGTSTKGGNGGDGLTSSITGTSIYYSGGGGGATFNGSSGGGTGGLGGGGNGGQGGAGVTSGSPNTGGGGGGSGLSSNSGGNGGSGVVIIRFDNAYDVITTSGNLVLEKSIVGTDRVVKFISGSGTIEFIEMWNGSQTGILDDYPGAAAAYSVRALSSTYTGPLMQVRRTDNGNTYDIYALANGALDETYINTVCSGTSCTVQTWYDQSGNGNDLTTSGSNQPTIYAAGSIQTSSGKPALNFDGSNDYLIKSALNITQPFSVFATFEEKSRAATNPIFDSESPRSTVFASSSTQQIVVSSGIVVSGGILTIAPHIVSSVHNASSSYLNVDGTNRFTNQNIGANSIGDLAIGWNNGGNKLAFANMYMSEFIVYSSNQIANISNIENNINSYYSIY